MITMLNHTSRFIIVALALCFCFTFCGCQSKYPMAPVSGTITFEGKPLENAVVLFNPSDGEEPGPGSAARTDAQGNYRLSLAVPGKDIFRAVVGPHDVIIQLYSEDGERKIMETKTTYEVPPKGTQTANFSLPIQ